ncbi:MAG TPA: hypothetical protein DDY98_04300, partial [Ruminococcaceae bacterium]|nr:hypothetical protein [Oscillospiraceae bacterium]
MKDKFDKKKQKISMADDEETASNKFPEPVSRGFAFDEAFFEGDFEEASEPSAPMAVIESADEETELAYDFGMFGSSNHSSAVYRPKAPTPSKPEETESQPHFSIQSEPQEAFASDLFESINEELTHMEAEPLAYEPLAQGTQPQKKETFSYDEFRARFTAPQEEPEPT